MKFHELLDQLSNLNTSGDLKSQNVEVVANAKKYFISGLDIKSDALKLEVTRDFFHPLSATDLINKMKDFKNMVNDEADCQVIIEKKASEPQYLANLFVSKWTVELIV